MLRQGLVGAGVPEDYADFLLAILGFLKQGYNSRTTDAVERLLGRPPIGFRDHARDNRAAWVLSKAA